MHYNGLMNLEEPIAILGFGTEGKYALKYLQAQGQKHITICDENEALEAPEGINLIKGKNAFKNLTDFQTILRSPGVKYHLPGINEAIDAGCNVTSLTKLTLAAAADRLTAITGTNGKTTTTALVEQLLRAHYGGRLIVGGNDRSPILQEALESPDQPLLMEASSFQFADLEQSPYMAAIINITPNHLDWHETVEEYADAKLNILRHQKEGDWALLNANDENTAKLQFSTPAQQFWIGQEKGEHWAMWQEGHLILSFDGRKETLLHFDQLNVKTHPDNLLFAAAIAKLHRVPATTIEEQMKLFKGVEHRLEYLRTLKDIHFYNDSSSTSPESTLTAIDQFVPRHLVLMLGGSSKNADFTYLAQRIVKLGVRVFLYGAEKERIKESIMAEGGKGLILEESQKTDFGTLVQDVYKLAKPEDNIVLSPACASFDMFKNAKERGRQFKEIVRDL